MILPNVSDNVSLSIVFDGNFCACEFIQTIVRSNWPSINNPFIIFSLNSTYYFHFKYNNFIRWKIGMDFKTVWCNVNMFTVQIETYSVEAI